MRICDWCKKQMDEHESLISCDYEGDILDVCDDCWAEVEIYAAPVPGDDSENWLDW